MHTEPSEHSDIFARILEASRSFIYRCDNDEAVTMTYLAGSVEFITGCRAEQLLQNRDLSFASLCYPDDLRPMIDKVDAAIASDSPWDVDYRLVRPDGSIILVRERGAAVRNERGEVAYLHGLVVDANAEFALRSEIEQNMTETETANREILALAQNIARSVRELSMLSINARIEAARAGDAGRGFSVVASEISALAEVNAKWAEKIATRMRA